MFMLLLCLSIEMCNCSVTGLLLYLSRQLCYCIVTELCYRCACSQKHVITVSQNCVMQCLSTEQHYCCVSVHNCVTAVPVIVNKTVIVVFV